MTEADRALGAIRRGLVERGPPSWPDLGRRLDGLLPNPLPAYALLPVATCRAAGGTLDDVLPVARAWVLTATSIRILDDCADRDERGALHEQIGVGAAANLAVAFLMHGAAQLEEIPDPDARRAVVADFHRAFLQTCRGQSRDIEGRADSLDDYLRLVEHKTGCGFAFAGSAGVRVVSERQPWVSAGAACGYHIGFLLQLLDDLEACTLAGGRSDLARGKPGFPVWFALARHPSSRPVLEGCLRGPVSPREEAAILAWLESVDIRRYVVWSALEERDLARASLSALPDPSGLALLDVYLASLLQDVSGLLGPSRTEGPGV